MGTSCARLGRLGRRRFPSPMPDFGERHAMAVPVKKADEPAAVRARYARRHGDDRRYSPLNPAVLLATQERQRAIADLFVSLGWLDLGSVRLVEVGCGSGGDVL